MDRLLALLYFLLSLFGIDTGTTTLVQRGGHDDAGAFFSRTTVQAGIARFDCVRSASGRCHYTVLPPRCAHTSVTSMRCPPKRFVLDSGTSRQVLGMARFRLCAGSEAAKPTTRCQLPEPE